VSPNSTRPYYHGGVVHVRTDGGAAARACEPAALLAEGGTIAVTARSLVSRDPNGPFTSLAVALERDAALRDAFATAIPVPSLRAWARARIAVVVLAIGPALMLLELDRELVASGSGAGGRLLADALLVAFVAFDVTRKTPRLPLVTGAALLALAMRFVLVATRLCGKGVHVAVWAGAAAALVAGFTVLARAPSPSRAALELLAKLGITRSDVVAAWRESEARTTTPTPLLVGAIAAAAGLPLVARALRQSGAVLPVQAAVFVAYGLAVPWLVRRAAERMASPSSRDVGERAEPPRLRVIATLFGIAAGLAATGALVHGVHQFFEVGTELARCTSRLDEASRRLLAAEAAEVVRRIATVRASTLLAILTTAAVPLAEERIYRGLLLDVLVRRYGTTYAVFASAAAFGLAHVGVYEVALYQTILLGVGFSVAYLEGGIVAAFAVHATWNLLNLL